MNKIIKFTSMNGETIYINMRNIECFGTIGEKTYSDCKKEYFGKTYLVPICLGENDMPYIVNESVDYILKEFE